jgi:asparagine synthase (glutamine-hydrolysing)
MCGIVGMASSEAGTDLSALSALRDTMVHRGPDDYGVWVAEDRCAGLGHRRLSIIDVSAAGRQPMADASGAIQLVFNGEIYNFRELREELLQRGHAFRTGTDTEVVIAAYREWGDACLERLQGMFALAIYDSGARRLLLARDRAGEKPLFVWRKGKRLAFASELKALFPLPGFPRRIDPGALDCYLAYGYVPRDLCIVQGVSKLPAGHLHIYDVASGDSTTRAYWDLPRNESNGASDEALVDELETVLSKAVARQLVADVPVAILLSGGVDSSLVTAFAARNSPRVKTFTVSFPGSGAFDESKHARLVARHFNTDHVEVRAETTSIDLLPALARQYDEPIADSSMVPTHIVCKLIRGHATVAVGGDGGDEVFGGYPHYSWLQRMSQIRRVLPGPARRAMSAAARRLPVGFRGRNYALGLGDEQLDVLRRVNVFFDCVTRRRLLRSAPATPSPEAIRVALGSDGRSLLDAAQRMDFRTYLVDDILVKVDRASMLASLETRAPFLDVGVIEFAFRHVPERLKATPSARKILLRKLAARVLPPEFDASRKQGFSIPLHRWVKGEWGAFMREVLSQRDAIFDHSAVGELFTAQRRGGSNENRLFALTIFELWRREYGMSL